jgi:hypothetical protein
VQDCPHITVANVIFGTGDWDLEIALGMTSNGSKKFAGTTNSGNQTPKLFPCPEPRLSISSLTERRTAGFSKHYSGPINLLPRASTLIRSTTIVGGNDSGKWVSLQAQNRP